VMVVFVTCVVMMMFVVYCVRSGGVHFGEKVSRSISKEKASLQSQKLIDSEPFSGRNSSNFYAKYSNFCNEFRPISSSLAIKTGE
jgi:hypothetical protein